MGGRIERLGGPEDLAAAIRRSLSVHPERGVRDHVHGFHSYPARLHPGTAARLIEDLAPVGGIVADPFCGCGTVLVEARRMGRTPLGLDLNPLAVRLTRFKTQPLSAEQRDDLLDAALRVAESAEDRRVEALGPTRQYEANEREEFDVHVLLELDGLADGIRKEPPGPLRHALLLALSSIFSKVARQPSSDPASKLPPSAKPGKKVTGKRPVNTEPPRKRLPSGFAIRFFVGRVEELVRQLTEYEELLPRDARPVDCKEGDARQLDQLGWRNVDLIVTSPPYPGVLDYASYHRTRLQWLGLDGTDFEQRELGARRSLQRLEHAEAASRWEQDFTQVLAAMRQTLSPSGRIAMVLADSLLAGEPYPADVVVERCGARAGLQVLARGSQRRPHFHAHSAAAFGRHPRYEHLLVLVPKAASAALPRTTAPRTTPPRTTGRTRPR
ncbi:MAG: hypothetical protein RL685_2469 [Pseudomonadota bacterium]